MKEYLIRFFNYNAKANLTVLKSILELADKQEAIALFSHMITAQDKWMNRIKKEKEDSNLAWFGVSFEPTDLENNWKISIKNWLDLLTDTNEADLLNDVIFINPNTGKKHAISLQDLMLQLNYHSIHHRAQINKLISNQGIKPPATDYIFSVLKEVK